MSQHTTARCISLIVPCFNEEHSLDAFFQRLETIIDELHNYRFEIICVDDGSRDNTLERLCQHAKRNTNIIVLELSRNFGKEAALTAGLDAATGDAVIPIDADLQHPPETIIPMIQQWEQGSDVVLAKRKSRTTDHPLQKFVTQYFYKLHNRISDCEIPRDVGDFRLMDRTVVAALKTLPERRRFMKGLFAWVGFRQSTVEFEVAPAAPEPRLSTRDVYGGLPLKVSRALALHRCLYGPTLASALRCSR